MRNMQFRVERQIWENAFAVHLWERDADGGLFVARPVILDILKPHGELTAPMMLLDNESVQRLADELWADGVRPSEGTGSAGAMAAVHNHLQDMRRLVFKDSKP